MHRTTLAWIVLVAGSIIAFAACDNGSRSPIGLEPAGQEPANPIDSRRCTATATIEDPSACQNPTEI